MEKEVLRSIWKNKSKLEEELAVLSGGTGVLSGISIYNGYKNQIAADSFKNSLNQYLPRALYNYYSTNSHVDYILGAGFAVLSILLLYKLAKTANKNNE